MDLTVLKILFKLKKELSLKTSKEALKSLLLSHQNYPSVLSFSDTLKKIGIENKVGRISTEQFLKLSPIFLAYTLKDGLVIIKEISEKEIKYYTGEDREVIKESIESFLLKWNGMVVLVDQDSEAIISKKEVVSKRIKTIKLMSVISSLIILGLLFFDRDKGFANLLFITKSIGVLVSSFLIAVGIDKSNELKFCKVNEKIDCNGVLNSSAAKIFSWLSMSDIGLIYFSGSFLTISIAALTSHFYNTLSFLNILSVMALPYVIFSIYYQGRVVKKWCVLCLTTVGLLSVEGIISLYLFNTNQFSFSLSGLQIAGFSFLSVIITWSYLKNLLINYFEFKNYKYKYTRIKKNQAVFSTLQEKESFHDTTFEANHISFGELSSEKKVTMIMNPNCPLCAEEFEKIEKSSGKHNFSLIFSESHNNEATLFLIELYYKVSESEFLIALSTWFKSKNLKNLQKKYAISISEKAQNTFDQHKKWCLQNNILQTPMIIHGQRRLSEHYTVDDLLEAV